MSTVSKIFSDLNTMRDFAKRVSEELDKTEIEVKNGNISVIITAGQRVKSVLIDDVPNEKVRLAMQEAIQKSQKVAAEKLTEIPKKMNLPEEKKENPGMLPGSGMEY